MPRWQISSHTGVSAGSGDSQAVADMRCGQNDRCLLRGTVALTHRTPSASMARINSPADRQTRRIVPRTRWWAHRVTRDSMMGASPGTLLSISNRYAVFAARFGLLLQPCKLNTEHGTDPLGHTMLLASPVLVESPLAGDRRLRPATFGQIVAAGEDQPPSPAFMFLLA